MTTQILMTLNPEASRIVFDKDNVVSFRADVANGVLYIRPTKRQNKGIHTLASFDTRGRGRNKIVIAKFVGDMIDKLELDKIIKGSSEFVLLPEKYGWYALLDRKTLTEEELNYVIEDGLATFETMEVRQRRKRSVDNSASTGSLRQHLSKMPARTRNTQKVANEPMVKNMVAASATPRKRGRPRIHDPETSIPSFRKRERLSA